jgi:hypothetical protein
MPSKKKQLLFPVSSSMFLSTDFVPEKGGANLGAFLAETLDYLL